jgi:hypothetical protein
VFSKISLFLFFRRAVFIGRTRGFSRSLFLDHLEHLIYIALELRIGSSGQKARVLFDFDIRVNAMAFLDLHSGPIEGRADFALKRCTLNNLPDAKSKLPF